MKECCLQENSGTGGHNVKQNKPSSERQISHAFSHMQNLDLKVKYIIYTCNMNINVGLFEKER
jgi:hypothetical protein